MRVVVSGYYGFGNVGDEAVLAAMLGPLRTRLPEARISVLSARPAATRRLHNVHSVPRTSPGMIGALAGCDLFLSGGGSLFQDVTSARSAVYYLGLLALATVLSRHTMVFAQGIGPLRRRWVRALARTVLNRTDLITVRDEDSLNALRELGVRPGAQLVADPVFMLEPAPEGHVRDLVGGRSQTPRIGVALRSWGGDAYLAPVLEALLAVRATTGATIVVFAFHPQRDLRICRAAADALGAQVIADLPPRETMAAIGTLDVLLGARLHALICAVAMGVIPVGLSYDPKVDGLFRRTGVGHLLPIADLRSDLVQQAVLSAYAQREVIAPQLQEIAGTLREEALRTADLAAALVARAR